LSQIRTFLDMESHEERIQEIISRNKELEASEERKRKAKQLEMQRKEMMRGARSNSGMGGGMGMGGNMGMPRTPTYSPAPQPATPAADSYDSYNAAKNPNFGKPMPTRGKGMQLGKKKTTSTMYDQVRGDLGADGEANAPLAGVPQQAAPPVQPTVPSQGSAGAAAASMAGGEPIQVTIAEALSARLSREGQLESFEVKGDLQL
ncbi:hypothetical protein KC352_g46593, partial [Hortaea werneckii]